MFKRVVDAIRRNRLVFISFATGFGLLSYELAAARILAPSIGSSTYVWTGVIGVIIAALSIGFYTGGKLADRRSQPLDIVWLLLLAAGMAALTLVSYQDVLTNIVDLVEDSRMQAVIAAIILFAPTSLFIGTTSPYLAKLNVQSLESTGQAVAKLDMFNSIGGITGTFVTGFILFGYIGSHEAVGLVTVLLVACSWLLAPRRFAIKRALLSGILVLVAVLPASTVSGVVNIDTPSAHYKVIQGFYDGDFVTGLLTGPGGTQSAVYGDGRKEPVFWYTGEMSRLTIDRQPDSLLLLGGGAFTLPQHLSEKLPDTMIDVVEIDPELLAISQQHFSYKNPRNVNEIFTDARTYVNQTDKKYDVILVDAYGDTSIPFSLMTKEYGQQLDRILKPNGVVIANIIGGLKGTCYETFAAVDAAYRAQFPHAIYANESGKPQRRANHIVLYSREAQPAEELAPLQSFNTRPYTDNYAPAERLFYACQQS